MVSCSQTANRGELKKKNKIKVLAKKLKLDKHQKGCLKDYLHVSFEGKVAMRDAKKEYGKNMTALFKADDFSAEKASKDVSKIMEVKKQLLDKKIAALKVFHETLNSSQRQQFSKVLLKKKMKTNRFGKEVNEDKRKAKKEKLIQSLNLAADKAPAFSKALEDSMDAKVNMAKLYAAFKQMLYAKVAEDTFFSSEHTSEVEAYLAKISAAKQKSVTAKETMHSLLNSEQRSQMASMMKKKSKKRWCKDCKDGEACKKCESKKKGCKDCKDGETCKKCKSKEASAVSKTSSLYHLYADGDADSKGCWYSGACKATKAKKEAKAKAKAKAKKEAKAKEIINSKNEEKAA